MSTAPTMQEIMAATEREANRLGLRRDSFGAIDLSDGRFRESEYHDDKSTRRYLKLTTQRT